MSCIEYCGQTATDTPKPSQLPVIAYFSEALLTAEIAGLFAKRPQYAGHELLVPQLNDYCALPHHDNGLFITRNQAGVEVLSNVCRHRQALILKGRGNAARHFCPMHRWAYDTRGTLIAAPRFAQLPCASLNLERFVTKRWRGLHFIGTTDGINEFDQIPSEVTALIDFDAYYFDHMEVHECNYNWKTFIEFYLEDYHVAPFHPGLGHFVSCDNLQWSFGKHWSAQTVGFHRGLSNPGDSEVYRSWHQATLAYYREKLPPIAAMGFLSYPNVMIEWYPLVLVISTIDPQGVKRSLNVVEYYHPQDLLGRDSWAATTVRTWLH
jgi:phenylpropionate dioxygenase-like ring-hydroxylating dioxygenase large terminal subunit